MKKTLSILLILAMVLSLGSAAFAEGAGTEKTVPVYRESMTGDETVTLRMVGDIPYMRIDDYYNRLIFTGAEKYPQQASPMTVTHSGRRRRITPCCLPPNGTPAPRSSAFRIRTIKASGRA